MEKKHTPGPWGWQSFGTTPKLVASHGMREIILASQRKGMNGSELTMNKDGILEPINPSHPNAKLIAAAPELLDTLIKIREWYEENHEKYFGEITPICFSEALSAIQKATV